VLATIPTEARGQRFAKLLPCRYFPDLLYTVLDNGRCAMCFLLRRPGRRSRADPRIALPGAVAHSVAARVRSARLANLPGAPASYDVVCVSDALRTVRGERFVDVVLAPLHELRLAAITSEGRLYGPSVVTIQPGATSALMVIRNPT